MEKKRWTWNEYFLGCGQVLKYDADDADGENGEKSSSNEKSDDTNGENIQHASAREKEEKWRKLIRGKGYAFPNVKDCEIFGLSEMEWLKMENN